MAYDYFYRESDESPGSEAGNAADPGRLVQVLGALVSLLLVAGLMFWTYKLMVRDISGVPVVRALEGPARSAPQTPGGRQAANQGLSVNEVAANHTAAAPAARVVLAPPPLKLTAADRPLASAPLPAGTPHDAVVVRASLAAAASPTSGEGAGSGAGVGAGVGVGAALDADKRAQIEALAAESATRGALANVLDAALAEALGAEGRMRRSPRPRARPERGATRLAAADGGALLGDVVALSAPAAPIDPDNLPAGTWLVQLGAFPTEDEAGTAQAALATRFADFLDDRRLLLQRAEANGAPFWRLRAMGFADAGDARRFCAALLAENASCIPVLTR